MSTLTLAHINTYALIALLTHWLVLWLGLYLIGRRPRSSSSVVIGLAFVCGAAYLLEAAYFFIPTTVRGVGLREQWLAGWCIFTPTLFLHGLLLMTRLWPRGRRWLLGCTYAFALVVFVGGFFSGVFNDFKNVTLDANGYLRNLPVARYYWVLGVQVMGTLLLAVAVLVRARFARPSPPKEVRRQLGLMKSGMVLIFVSIGLIYVNGVLTKPVPDVLLFPLGMIGTVMMVAPLVRYSGQLGGQMLRHDLNSSLLATVLVLIVFVATATLMGASVRTVAATGWVMVVPVALGGELRALADRVFYGRAGRIARSDLRTAEAYAGVSAQVDLDVIGPGYSGEVVGYLSDLERASLVSTGAGSVDQDWLRLLARDEFASVRDALEIPQDWTVGDRLPRDEVCRRALAKLLPRERQALGLWYMGHSDKDMARLMGVKAGVPRSYLNDGKKKLGLSSGPSLMLYVYFSGFVGSDALPLLENA